MAKEATTIYVDDSAIWVLKTRGRQVKKWASMPLEPGLIKDGTILDENAVAAKVKELWQTQGIGTRKVIAGINGINCLYRLISLPELPKNILPEAVNREADRILAIPLEQLHLSWQTLPVSKEGTLVYLVASPRNSLDTLISTLHKAGLNPYLMDLRPLALARTVTEPEAIIVDVQPGNFDVVVLMEGIPQVVRSLSLAQEASLEEKIPLIREELERAITFYNSSHATDKHIGATVPILISGELAQQQDTWKLLLGKLGHPVQALPSPVEAPENFPLSQYTTNVGLALKEVLASEKGAIAYSLVNFNALPEIYLPKPHPISEILFVPVITVGIVLLALGAYANITASTSTTDLRANLASINQMATSAQAQIKNVVALTEEASSLEATAAAFATTLDSFSAGRDDVIGDLAKINGCLPGAQEDKPLKVTHDGDTLIVEGLFGRDDVFGFAEDLRASGRFTLVVITNMSQDEQQQIRFTLRLSK